jgi:alanine-glyoxylate transaminase/serine-glyoxylate transaminase/serine-pyruvate transaminase
MTSPIKRGRNFLHTPGPTNIPDRILRAMNRPAVDFMAPEFVAMSRSCFADLKPVFRTAGQVFMYAASGHGAWEAALANVLSAGDKVLVPETGNFSVNWGKMAASLGVEVETLPGDWRRAVDPAAVEARLAEDKDHTIRAVLLVHVDTATATTSDVAAVRRAIDAVGHPCLYLVDTIASLACAEFRMDDWGVDVAVGASQKGLMCPPGVSFTAVSDKAFKASQSATLPRSYWNWAERFTENNYIRFCGTAPIHLVYALREALDMIFEEGLDAIAARHARLAGAVQAAVEAWGRPDGVRFNAVEPAERACSVTTILTPEGLDGEEVRRFAREHFDVSLGGGLAKLNGKAFRIGHMGDLNAPMVIGAVGGVEATLEHLGVPLAGSGVAAATRHLADTLPGHERAAPAKVSAA